MTEANGDVDRVAKIVWEARPTRSLNNLKDIFDEKYDTQIKQNSLEYLRSVAREGVSARSSEERCLVKAKTHKSVIDNLRQVYEQMGTETRRGRTVVVPTHLLKHSNGRSSPYPAVGKMKPDLSDSSGKSIVHDPRGVNAEFDSANLPPAIRPRHRQLAQLILYFRSRCPGTPVLISRTDASGAFQLSWLRPEDPGLFAEKLPWNVADLTEEEGDDSNDLGEREKLGNPRASITVTNLTMGFGSKGGRPESLNREKEVVEGGSEDLKTCWGLEHDTTLPNMRIPEGWILKGAHPFADPTYDMGNSSILRLDLQRVRGPAQLWSPVHSSLKTDLKAIDNFFGPPSFQGRVQCRPSVSEQEAWEDTWDRLAFLRLLCARPETGGTRRLALLESLLDPREKIALPGEAAGAVWITSDATPDVREDCDWSSVLAERAKVKNPLAEPKAPCEDEKEDSITALGESLRFAAFAATRAPAWRNRLVVYGSANQVARGRFVGRKARHRTARLMLKVLAYLEIAYGFQTVGGNVRTYHNRTADLISRIADEGFEEKATQGSSSLTDITTSWAEAVTSCPRWKIPVPEPVNQSWHVLEAGRGLGDPPPTLGRGSGEGRSPMNRSSKVPLPPGNTSGRQTCRPSEAWNQTAQEPQVTSQSTGSSPRGPPHQTVRP